MIQEVAGNSNYTHKTIDSKKQLNIMAKDSESYRKIVRKLDEEGASYHTYYQTKSPAGSFDRGTSNKKVKSTPKRPSKLS